MESGELEEVSLFLQLCREQILKVFLRSRLHSLSLIDLSARILSQEISPSPKKEKNNYRENSTLYCFSLQFKKGGPTTSFLNPEDSGEDLLVVFKEFMWFDPVEFVTTIGEARSCCLFGLQQVSNSLIPEI